MTNDQRISNPQAITGSSAPLRADWHWGLDIPWEFIIGPWSFSNAFGPRFGFEPAK
jgi:hypothetical protein